MWHFKQQQGDVWLSAIREHRVEWLMKREYVLAERVVDLREEFEKEKVALQEIREERIAQERMMGFIDGLQKSPAMMAYMVNPRNRLHIVRPSGEESA